MSGLEILLAVVVAILGSGGIVSFLQLRTTRSKTISETERTRIEAQSIIISNLQAENARLGKEIETLRMEVAELRGHLQAMERLKVAEIATAVADKVVAKLVGDEGLEGLS